MRPVLLATLLVSSVAVADPGLRDLMHSRSFAMGGAYRASGLGADSVNGNPAAMTLYRRYIIELSGAWDVQTKYAFGTMSMQDSQTSMLAGGVSYHIVKLGRGAEQRIAHFSTLALAMPLSEAVHLGISGRHLLMTGARTANGISVDAGFLLRFGGFTAGFSGHNLIDVQNPEFTRYYALSAAFNGGFFALAADVPADFGLTSTIQLAYHFGAEYILGSSFPIRLGYMLDTIAQTQHISGGLGYMVEGGGAIDLAYRHEFGGTAGKLLSLTLRIQL